VSLRVCLLIKPSLGRSLPLLQVNKNKKIEGKKSQLAKKDLKFLVCLGVSVCVCEMKLQLIWLMHVTHTRSTHARTHTNRAIQLMRKNCLYVNRAEMGQTKKNKKGATQHKAFLMSSK